MTPEAHIGFLRHHLRKGLILRDARYLERINFRYVTWLCFAPGTTASGDSPPGS